jgi:hypothetical protein
MGAVTSAGIIFILVLASTDSGITVMKIVHYSNLKFVLTKSDQMSISNSVGLEETDSEVRPIRSRC